MNNPSLYTTLKWDMIPNTDNGDSSYYWLNNQIDDNEKISIRLQKYIIYHIYGH